MSSITAPRRATAAIALVLAGALGVLSACGTHTSGNPQQVGKPAHSTTASTKPTTQPPATGASGSARVVKLANTFSPRTLSLTVGDSFTVQVSPSVQATMIAATFSGTSTAHRVLAKKVLSASLVRYTAVATGSVTITTPVKPACKAGQMCPHWVTLATLKVTVTA